MQLPYSRPLLILLPKYQQEGGTNEGLESPTAQYCAAFTQPCLPLSVLMKLEEFDLNSSGTLLTNSVSLRNASYLVRIQIKDPLISISL